MFDAHNYTNAELPALAVRGAIPLPHNEIRLDVGRSDSLKALKMAEQYQNYIVLLIQPDQTIEMPEPSDLNPVAVLAQITLNMKMPNNSRRVKFNALARCKVIEYLATKPNYTVLIEQIPTIEPDIEEATVLVNKIGKALSKDAQKLNFAFKDLPTTPSQEMDGDAFSDFLAYHMPLNYDRHLAYLNTTDVITRLKMITEDIELLKYFNELDSKIDSEVKKSITESQKEYYLREKMKAIQDELGDKAKKDSDIDELRKMIKEKAMPDTMRTKALDELNRYISVPNSSPESGIIRTYLDFVLSLPWQNDSADCEDIAQAKVELDCDHYGLEAVKERILEYLAVKIMTKKNPQTILCFVGPPGVGKTSLARSIAKALNKNFVKQALGGVKDESEIRGHRRTYVGALPGRILQGMQKAGTSNPVFLLDEIDKMSSDYKGDPTSAMLEVLDSEQNRYFSDHYLEEPFDLSRVFFIATANYLGNIPAPLRDRLEIVELSSYTEYEKFEIARRHLLGKQLDLHGLKADDFSISDQAIYTIIQKYTREAGVRELERELGTIIRKAIKNILLENVKRIDVTVDNLTEYLGKARFDYNMADDTDQVGTVTGLAYTQFGGDTLSVEVTHYQGDGKVVLTGQLGDVMKESAQAALSYVKSSANKFNIPFKEFRESDLHIHVPEGAIPKDGPSAGVTIATAIISAFSGRSVDHTVGMTGEINLRGRVLPIGGLREKTIAAHRSGLKTILIPKENVKDLDDIPESVKNSLTIIPISTIDEAVKYALKA